MSIAPGRSRSTPVVEWARRLGCEAAIARSGHWRITWGGRFVAAVSSTPSDRRTVLNERARVARKLREIKGGATT